MTEVQEQKKEENIKKATYVVEVLYQQNSTWQGNVTWNERRQKSSFRSELELIKLLDNEL